MLKPFVPLLVANFMPHGFRMNWDPGLIGLYVVSDVVVVLAYASILFLLLHVARKRTDISFKWMFLAFGGFILACGATHALNIVTLWNPVYRLEGVVKAFTALASGMTAFCLWRLIPSLLKVPTAASLATAHQLLRAEVLARKTVEDRLQFSRDPLESSLSEHTTGSFEANESLRERDRQVENALAAARVGTWKWDSATGALTWDAHIKKLYGLPPESGVTHINQFFELVHPADREPQRLALQSALRSESEYNMEFRVVHPDGSAHWIRGRGALQLDPAGAPVGMVGINMDIAAKKEAQLALFESELQFSTLADTIPHLTWMANPDGRIIWYNRRWYEYTNTTPEQMVGNGWMSVHDPKELPRVIERWAASLASGEPFEMEFPLLGGDGLFRWFLTRGTPILDSEKRVVRWFGTNTDVTAIRQAREALRESERELHLLANAMPQIVWTEGSEGVIDYYNQRWYEYTGQSAEESGSMRWWKPGVHADDLERVLAARAVGLASGKPFELECRLRRGSDQVYRWHLSRSVPYRNQDGRLARWIGTSTDIHEQKTQEEGLEAEVLERTEELREMLTEKETLLKEVHHRVKNNLQVISSLLKMQGDSLTDPGAVAALKESQRRVLSMALIHERLYGSQQMDEIDFGEYTQTLVNELFYSYSQAGNVTSRIRTSPVRLNIDQAIPCGLILNELVSNALQYAYPEGTLGEIIIELLEAPPGRVRLTVSDKGVGLPEGLDWKHSRSLGLPIVELLAKQIGGKLTVHSKPGATFVVDFPKQENHKRHIAPAA